MKTWIQPIILGPMTRVRASIIGQYLTKAFDLGILEFEHDLLR